MAATPIELPVMQAPSAAAAPQPEGMTLFFNLYLYKTFFTYQNMSYGSTLAWLLFAITLVITLVLVRTSRRWVYYAGDR